MSPHRHRDEREKRLRIEEIKERLIQSIQDTLDQNIVGEPASQRTANSIIVYLQKLGYKDVWVRTPKESPWILQFGFSPTSFSPPTHRNL